MWIKRALKHVGSEKCQNVVFSRILSDYKRFRLTLSCHEPKTMKLQLPLVAALSAVCSLAFPQNEDFEKITIRTLPAGGSVYFVDCVDGFGGGNVAASVGKDGIMMVDDMFAAMAPKLKTALKQLKDAPIRIIVNTHFH